MIELTNVTFAYDGAATPTFSNVSLTVSEGDFFLVVGNTGSGKSTFLQMLNGLVPRFSGGRLSGDVSIDGRSTSEFAPREFADRVGFVSQEPFASFVTDTVEEELAYSMEQLAIEPDVMRKRVEETLDLLGIAELRDRRLATLSGGQQQRVAIGAVLTAHPRVLVLDEPTSALDPGAAEEVLASLSRLVHDLGVTVVIAEHRLERVVQFADTVAYLDGAGGISVGSPSDTFAASEIAPPIVELGRLAGWDPLPMSIRDARRLAKPLREELSERFPDGGPVSLPGEVVGAGGLVATKVSVDYGGVPAVRSVDLELRGGEIAALMGRNGAGKSSLLWALRGAGSKSGGEVKLTRGAEGGQGIALVPQEAGDLLYRVTVSAECASTDEEASLAEGATFELANELVGPLDGDAHPKDLSAGQRLGLAIAVQSAAEPSVFLLDEPTRGLDYPAKARLAAMLFAMAERGCAVLLSTHDVEFVASVAHRVAVIADGEIVADGPTAEVITSSPSFAPQVAKILAPGRWLTPAQVGDALAAT